ncbi:hypothetical protein RQP53_00490 [Paucibacter sp. APW11]|uniref:Uncharacterized protein n=1 Tax=Roseateles aquae TaxID=3077235 RepID=A0ABU3P593_9BURK|nr:hypothetical protein [Paucibacter sp. APW11]MDT8997746.1 hypothetical protein [Paucibacter sp. APW11]
MAASSSGLDRADPTPLAEQLGLHLLQCHGARGRLHRLRCIGEASRDWLMRRPASGLLLLALPLLVLYGLI